MPSLNSPVTSHRSRVTAFISFKITLLSKNAPANHLESHSCKNKGLKVPCFHTLTKKGVGVPPVFHRTPALPPLLPLPPLPHLSPSPASNLKPTIRPGWSSRASGASRGSPPSNLRSWMLN